MRHIVDIEELRDFTFEQVVCSSSKEHKKLVVYVCPYDNCLHYKLYVDDLCVMRCLKLEDALKEYNEQ